MTTYTPTTEEVRGDYAAHRDEHMYSPTSSKHREFVDGGGGAGEFDRWLAAHDAELLEREALSGLYGTAAQSRLLERARALRVGDGEDEQACTVCGLSRRECVGGDA